MNIDEIVYDDTKLEDLNFFWTKTGVPCFIADRENIEEIVEELGFSIYYLICNVGVDRKVETKTNSTVGPKEVVTYVTDLSSKIVKVVNNFVGRSISEVKNEEIYDFAVVREEAEYKLPYIPRILIDKLDEFFRLVDHQHGTESIVLLTFDPSKNDSSGWGILVPDQTNTSVHCKYDADSIVHQKPDHVLIVGSVHSHPNMSAYASGTDHADQADFDGLHITFGWQKSVNNGATQYHIELQMSGTAYSLKPDEVFEDYVFTKEPDPDVIAWSQKVKKVQPPTGGSASPAAHLPGQPASQTKDLLPQESTQVGIHNFFQGDPSFQQTPSCNDPDPHLIIAEIDYKDINSDCPSCGHDPSYQDFIEGFCPVCDIMFCHINSSYHEIFASAKKYLRDRKKSHNINYYLWIKDDNNQDLLMKIVDKSETTDDSVTYLDNNTYVTPKGSVITEESYYDSDDALDETFYAGFDKYSLVCCNLDSESSHLCSCVETIYYSDLLEFDEAHPYDIYDQNGNCSTCANYYARNCPAYHTAIIDYVRFKTLVDYKIQDCESYSHYKNETDSTSYYESTN